MEYFTDPFLLVGEGRFSWRSPAGVDVRQSGYTAKRLCAAVSPRNFSEAEDFFLDIRRHLALEQGRVTFRTLVTDRVNAWSSQRGRYGSDDRPADLASG